MNEKNIEVGNIVSFKHKSRSVKGEVKRVDEKGFSLILQTDYLGKNEDWFAGEDKHFFKANIRGITIHKNNNTHNKH